MQAGNSHHKACDDTFFAQSSHPTVLAGNRLIPPGFRGFFLRLRLFLPDSHKMCLPSFLDAGKILLSGTDWPNK